VTLKTIVNGNTQLFRPVSDGARVMPWLQGIVSTYANHGVVVLAEPPANGASAGSGTSPKTPPRSSASKSGAAFSLSPAWCWSR
jgi:hypothetical protein